jgi:hypothetical protein
MTQKQVSTVTRKQLFTIVASLIVTIAGLLAFPKAAYADACDYPIGLCLEPTSCDVLFVSQQCKEAAITGCYFCSASCWMGGGPGCELEAVSCNYRTSPTC